MKRFVKLLIILAVCFFVLLVSVAVKVIPFRAINNLRKEEVRSGQKTLPVEISTETTTVYGEKIQTKCLNEYNDFIKNHGADYFKCLVDFDFNEQYCGGLDPNAEGLSNVNIVVILDASGSMAEKIDSQAKIDIAKKAVSDFLAGMPQGVRTGLIVYGDKGSNSLADKNVSCKGIEEVVKLGMNNNKNIISAMGSFGPKGWTPIAGAFDFAKNVFKGNGSKDKDYLILVSDGIESCDGNPLVAAEDLKSEIPDIKLNIIGFTNSSETHEFLQRVAERGGGSYLTANNSSEISRALNAELLLIKKDCLYVTFYQMSSRYNANYLSNLNCWLNSFQKESDDFTKVLSGKSTDEECNLEIPKILRARQNDFWYKKEELADKNSQTYKKVESDLNDQVKIIEDLQNRNH